MTDPTLSSALDAEARVHQFLEDRLAAAVSRGMREALTDREVLSEAGSVALDLLQQRAREKTGGWVLGVVRSALSRWLVIAFLLLLVAKALGFPAALKVWAMATGNGTEAR